ncbi:ATP-binding protein [bacterium]|nr:ATP-binding protein [bacterium]
MFQKKSLKTAAFRYFLMLPFLILFVQIGFAQSNVWASARLYAEKGSDTTLVLLNKIKPTIDFEKPNDKALEYLLIKCKYNIETSTLKIAWQVLKEAEMHYNISTKQDLKLSYELVSIHRDMIKLQKSKKLEPVARAFLLKAMNSNFPEFQVEGNILMFRLFKRRSVKDSMNYYLNEANTIAINNNLNEKQALILRLKGLMYSHAYDDNSSAFEYFNRSSDMFAKIGFELYVARNLIDKAARYRWQGRYEEAIKLLQEANVISRKNNAERLEGFVNRAMGLIYQDVDNHEEAIKRLNLFKSTLPDSSVSYVSARIDTFLADSYLALGDLKKAETLFQSSITLKEKINDSYTLPDSYTSLGNLYLKERKFVEAKSQFEKAIKLFKKSKIKRKFANPYLGMSKMLFVQNKLKLAKKNGLLALKYAEGKELVETKFAALVVLAKIASKKKDFSSANQYYKESVSLQDSVMNFGKALKVTNIIAGYESEKREFELLSLKSENQAKASELEQNELRSKLYLLGFISIVVTFLLFLRSFIQNRKARQQQQLLNASLNESNRKLSESNAQLEQFAHTASHDLKSPLTAINLFSSLLETNIKTKVGKKERRYIHGIAKSGKNLVAMIDDMLDFSKVGAKELSIEQTDLDVLVKNAISSLLGYAKENGVALKHLRPFPHSALVDAVKLKRVFQNIIANAIKFRDTNKEHNYVYIDFKELNGFYQFSITDNGIGIPKTGKNIFKPFTHLNTDENYTGTGMGLTICEKIITKHGGEIWYESELKKGTSFYFTIPTEENFNKSESVGKNLVNESV